MGAGEGAEPRPQAVGDRQDHRPDVAGPVRVREAGVHGGVRDGKGRPAVPALLP